MSYAKANLTIDVQHVSLDLRFDWEKKQAYGFAKLTLLLNSPSDEIALDAGFLTIQSITINKMSTSFIYKGGDEDDGLIIKLGKKYKAKEKITIHVQYHTNYINNSDPNNLGGSFGIGLRFFKPTLVTPKKRKQIWSQGEPDGNKYWFPCNEDISDIHTTEVKLTVEKPLTALSNGKLISTIDNKDNSRTFHYRSDVPFPNYLVSIVVGEYLPIKQNSKGIPIHTYGYPDEVEAIKATVELLPEMMEFITEKTGVKYPYSQYNQIVVQDYPFPSRVGQHTASILSDNYIDDYGVHKDFRYLWDGVAVQALASQWYGNLITPKSWSDIWLNNAFAHYLAGQFTEYKNGRDEYLIWYALLFEKAAVKGDWETGVRHPIVVDSIEDLTSFTNDNYSKLRGALVLRMLQKEIGEENWWKALKHYTSKHANKQVSTHDFQNSMEQVTGKNYQWFFDQWVYKIGYPQFEINKKYDANKKELIINIAQNQEADTSTKYNQVNYFQGKMDIEVDEQIFTIELQAQKTNTIILPMNTSPKWVNVDVERTWIGDITQNKSTEEHLSQLTASKDVLAKWESINALVQAHKDSLTPIQEKENIVTSLKQIVTSNNYWRLRNFALRQLFNILPQPYNAEDEKILYDILQNDESWVQATALSILGNTKDQKYESIYLKAFNSHGDRVINAAAIALGKNKSTKAYDMLITLDKKPSWKSQSRISALNGLQQLGDERAVNYVLDCIKDNTSPRWYLATPTWDYPYAAVNTIVALGKGNLAYPILLEQLKTALQEDDVNDIFQIVELITMLNDSRISKVYELLKVKYGGDRVMMEVVETKIRRI
jgi:aminopeptidase N